MVADSLWQGFVRSFEPVLPGVSTDPWFSISAVLELRGPLDPAALDTAFGQLAERHDVLRRDLDSGREHSAPRRVEHVDEAGVAAGGGWATLVRKVSPASPIRLRLARREQDVHVMSLHIQHLVSDPPSLWLAVSELAALYSALVAQAPPPSGPVHQFDDYVAMEHEHSHRHGDEDLAWWKDTIGGATFRSFGSIGAIGAPAPFAFREVLLPAQEHTEFLRRARRSRLTPFVMLLAAFACELGTRLDPPGMVLVRTLFNERGVAWRRVLGPCLVPAYLPLPPPPPVLTEEYAVAVRDLVLDCRKHARIPVAEVRRLNGIFDDPANRIILFEHVPFERPAPIAFGDAVGTVVDATGPVDIERPTSLTIRTRPNEQGDLACHVAGDGRDWSRADALALCLRTAERARDM